MGGSQGEWVDSVLVTSDNGQLLVGTTDSFGAEIRGISTLIGLNAAEDVVWSRTYLDDEEERTSLSNLLAATNGGVLI
jgi:hypothetical protein